MNFYNPKHSDDRERLDRLESQVEIIMRLSRRLHDSLSEARNESMRSEEVKQILLKNRRALVKYYLISNYDTDDEEEASQCALRIAKLFVHKRHLLHILLFIFSNEPELAQPHLRELKDLEDLVEEDTSEWMEILDFVHTIKNPNYLQLN